MVYIKRLLGAHARKALARGKSILLFGARQTGKTTFVHEELQPDIEISFVTPDTTPLCFYHRKPSNHSGILSFVTDRVLSAKTKLSVIDFIWRLFLLLPPISNVHLLFRQKSP